MSNENATPTTGSEANAIPTPGMVSAANFPPQEGHVAPKDDEEEHRGDLLDQFYLTLGVMLLATPDDEREDVHTKLNELFNRPRSWRNAYEFEQLLCLVMSEPQLTVELKRRLAEAKALKLEYLDIIEAGLNSASVEDKRIAFQRLLNDLQWFYVKRIQQRSAGKRLMRRVSALFVVTLMTLFLVLIIQFFAHPIPTQSASNAPVTPRQPAAATPQSATATPPTAAPPQPVVANGAAK